MQLRFFGQYLVEKEVISTGILAKAVGIQESVNRTFGQTALSMGLLTLEEVTLVNRAQRTLDMLYGDAAVKLGLLTDNQVAQVLAEQKRNHLYIGEALVKIGAIDKERLKYYLDEFAREQAPFRITGRELPDNVPWPHFCLIVWDTSHKMLARIANLTLKPDRCELVNKIEGNGITVAVDLSGDIITRFIITFPSFVRRKIAMAMLNNDDIQFDEVICGKKNITETIESFVNIICDTIISKAAGIGIGLVTINCDIRDNDDDIFVSKGNIALMFPFYLPTCEWIDVAIILPT